MQTFLPYADFGRCARVLDDRRLGKQRVETLQMLRALHLYDYGWRRHPAVLMWRGHTAALVSYGIAIVGEWTSRGHRDSTEANIVEFVHPDGPRPQPELGVLGMLPPWLGWDPLHRSHRSALLRKQPEHYGPYFGDVAVDLPYVWPDPPAPAGAPTVCSGWVVRGTRIDDSVAVRALAPGSRSGPGASRQTKGQRQTDRFVRQIQSGDRVVLPDDSRLAVATVIGHARRRNGLLIRDVVWVGELARTDLAYPAALQHPQDVFPLFDESVLHELA